MNYFDDDKDKIEEILKIPYIYEQLDEAGTKELLDALVPESMYVIYHSQLLKDEQTQNPDSFKMERFYNKYFTVEQLDDGFIAYLKTTMPDLSLKMGHPPKNMFIPKYEDISSMKEERKNADQPGCP